jgi:hypothetical protein
MQLDMSAITEKGKQAWQIAATQIGRIPAKRRLQIAALIAVLLTLVLATRWLRTHPLPLLTRWRTGTTATTSESAAIGWSASSLTTSMPAMSAGSTPQPASTSTPSNVEGIVTAEDNQEYLLPSLFGLKVLSPEELSYEVNALEGRVSMLEDMVARRVMSRH